MENQILDEPILQQQPTEYAGFWLRFVAVIIDGIILSIPQYALGFAMTGVSFFGASDLPFVASNPLFSVVIPWLYGAFMESSKHQATLGKMAVGIKVTDLDYNGPISFGRATGRYFGKMVSSLILLIGFIMAGFTERKQALHDMMANTLVVKK